MSDDNDPDAPSSRWTCEACGCHTNTEANNSASCGICGTRRVLSHPSGRLRRGLWGIGGLADNNYDDDDDIDMEEDDDVDSEVEHSDEDVLNGNRAPNLRRRASDMLSVSDRLSMALNPSRELGRTQAEAQENSSVNSNELFNGAVANGNLFQPYWSSLHCSSSIKVEDDSRQVACVFELGSNANCVRSSVPIPSSVTSHMDLASDMPAADSPPSLIGWRITFEPSARDHGRNADGPCIVGVVTEEFSDFSSRNGLQHSRFFWGVEDNGRKYEGGTRGVAEAISFRNASRISDSVLFASKEILTLALDVESGTIYLWKDSRFLGAVVSGVPKSKNCYPVAAMFSQGGCVAITGLTSCPSTIITEYLRAQQKQKDLKNGHVARQHFRRTISLVKIIQSNIRMWMYRKYLSFLIQWSVVLQARFRGRRSRIGYKYVLEVITCLQSSVRAWHTRRVWARFRQQRIIKYRRQIFELWERAFRPLIFRAKFWTFYQGMYEFRHLAIHEDELVSLWVYLGLKPLHIHHRRSILVSARSSLGAGISNDLDLGQHMGWRSQEIYHRFRIVQVKLDQLRASEGNLLTPTFPEEINYANGASEKLFMARRQLMMEQAEMYEKLTFHTSEETLYHIYELFHIPRKDKEKKKKVVDMLWRKHSLIAASCEVVLMKGINKDCNKRSMRVRKLYDTRNQQESITENLNAQSNEWVKERYEKRMRDDITASSQALFSSALNLQESGCKHTSNNLVTKRCHTRAEIIRKYLSCDQYGNRNCIRRTAVRIRQPKKKRNVGVQDLVDKGFEISCVSDISLETSITSY